MLADLRTDFLGAEAKDIGLEDLEELEFDRGEIEEVLHHLGGHPDSRHVFVVLAVAEPATHLEQGVEGAGFPDEVGDGQALEGDAA